MAGHRPDPPLPLGAKAYLAAFDRYLAASKSGDSRGRREARGDMSDRLDVMLAATPVDMAHRTHGIGTFTSESGLRAAYVGGEIEADEFEDRLAVLLDREERAA